MSTANYWQRKFNRYSNKFRLLALKIVRGTQGKGLNPYTLVNDQLYILHPIELENSRVHLNYRKFKAPKDASIRTITETCYLLLLHENNLAHFFHDIFFPVYVRWRKNPHTIFASISEDAFLKDFLMAVFGPENVIFANRAQIYQFTDLLLVPEGRDLRSHEDYVGICKEIKQRCFQACDIKENRTDHLLYGRSELTRKKLLGIDEAFLKTHHIKQVALAEQSFKAVMDTLARAKTFTYMVGAGVFYLLFLNDDVQVLEINPYQNNSWAQMFGIADLCQLEVFVSQNIELTRNPAQGNPLLDSHVYFDDAIKKKLLQLIS